MAETKVTFNEIANDYSTSEVNTGRKWVDGSAIYQKTISMGTLPNSTSKNVAHGISSITYMISMNGFAYFSNGTVIPLPHVATSSLGACVALNTDGTNVTIVTGSDRTGATGYVTLLYTK